MKSQDIHIAFLRGINVSGKNIIQMKALTALMENMGCSKVQTYIQSGNIVFEKSISNKTLFAKKIEKAILDTFGWEVPVLILSATELGDILLNQPYTNFLKEEASSCYYTLLFEAVDQKSIPVLPADAADLFQVSKNVVYLYCAQGYGKTKWNNNFFEKKLKVNATTRNHATMKTLYEMSQVN